MGILCYLAGIMTISSVTISSVPYCSQLISAVLLKLPCMINRRDVAGKLFVHRTEKAKTHFRNPVKYSVKQKSHEPAYNYCLRIQNNIRSPPLKRTERFCNFVTIKYNT